MKEAEVAAADDGIRLDRWFKRHYPGVPHAALEKHLRKGLIRLDGKKAKSSDRVVEGQTIRLAVELQAPDPAARKQPALPHSATPQEVKELQDAVLYRDENVMVVNKPHGLAVQGGTGQKKSLDGMLDILRFGSTERPRLVHRLDKDTSGCLVLARSAKSAAVLAKKFAGRDVEKIYVALVVGLPLPMKGEIRLKIAKAGNNFEKMEVDEENGQSAVTEYQVLEHLSNKLSWVELKPITGRTHQLRVHMAAIGHPIVGDGKYGGRDAYIRGMDFSEKLHLHAARVIIPDAFGRTLDVKAKLPPHIKESRKLLGLE